MKSSYKILKTLLILIFISLSCYSQTKCSCIEDAKNNTRLIATKVLKLEYKKGLYLKFQCASMRRIYYNDEDGKEVEVTQLACTAQESSILKLAKNFEYYFPENQDGKYKNKQLLTIFFNKIKTDSKKYFQLDLNENREIERISQFYLPDKI
jgi:hypothetical protein